VWKNLRVSSDIRLQIDLNEPTFLLAEVEIGQGLHVNLNGRLTHSSVYIERVFAFADLRRGDFFIAGAIKFATFVRIVTQLDKQGARHSIQRGFVLWLIIHPENVELLLRLFAFVLIKYYVRRRVSKTVKQ
jgi:hypothetical protein